MAIAGNLAAATSVYTILSGICQSLHSHDASQPPKVVDFINLALRISHSVYEDVRALGDTGLFGFFLFGSDIKSGVPFAVKISTELSNTGVYEVSARNCALGEGQISLLGSGADEFKATIAVNNGVGSSFPDLFYDFVKSGKVPTVGGMPQMLVATSQGVSIEPVLIGSSDGESCSIFHSGLRMDGYNSVGEFGVGLFLRSFNMELFERKQALKDEGYNANDESLSVGQVNQAILQMLLNRSVRNVNIIKQVGTVTA